VKKKPLTVPQVIAAVRALDTSRFLVPVDLTTRVVRRHRRRATEIKVHLSVRGFHNGGQWGYYTETVVLYQTWSQEAVWQHCRDLVLGAVTHEVDESLVVGERKVFDPHVSP
jgi:hypothetical protein